MNKIPKSTRKFFKAEEKYDLFFAENLANELVEWLLEKDEKGNIRKDRIYVSHFLKIEKQLPKSTVNYLKNKFEYVKTAFEFATEVQETKLLVLATGGHINVRFAEFVLKILHKYEMEEKISNAILDFEAWKKAYSV